ncbi:MAG: cell wall hydrolase [Lachnospiraceae bacterium]|nr:cell wall hydrolase [Lachnospiraceae bacterium]
MTVQSTCRKRLIVAGFFCILMFLCIHVKADAAWKQNTDGSYSWYSSSGKLARSKWINSKYYVDADGIRVTGLQKIGDYYYYFNKKTGALISGTWIKSGSKYYYARKSGGALYTSCRKKIGGYYYYFNAKGVRTSGKKTISGKTYYFSKTTGKMVTKKWVCLSSKYYYFGSNGVMVKSSWVGRYYVNSKGVRLTSQWKGSKYLGSDGKCVSGLQEIDGEYYYFNTKTYKKVTNKSVTVGQYTYYFDNNGVGTLTQINGIDLATVSVEDTYYTDEAVDDETLLAAIIYCEAGNQSYTGQLAVGLVILNRVNSDSFEASTLREVIYSTSQFAAARNGSLTKALAGTTTVSSSCKKAAKKLIALNETYKTGKTPTLTVNGKTVKFTYLFFMTSSSYKKLGLTASYLKIGDHVFFKTWK